MFLTDDEIAALTGRQRHNAQASALRAMGVEHKARPDGSLAVLRAHVVHLLGGETPATVGKMVEPDWGAVNA